MKTTDLHKAIKMAATLQHLHDSHHNTAHHHEITKVDQIFNQSRKFDADYGKKTGFRRNHDLWSRKVTRK